MDKATKQFRLQQWALAIREQKQSGLSVNAWCEQQGISRDAFFYRQRALRRALADTDAGKALLASQPVFAEVKLSNSRRQSQPAACTTAHACIHTADVDILLGADAPMQLIANILKAVRSC